MQNVFLVFLGGGIGSGLRYLLSQLLNQKFPFGTLFVNVVGSFLLIIIAQLFVKGVLSESTRLLLATGLMGGFTTYSSFNAEVFQFLKGGQYGLAIFYLFSTMFLCLLVSLLGVWWMERS